MASRALWPRRSGTTDGSSLTAIATMPALADAAVVVNGVSSRRATNTGGEAPTVGATPRYRRDSRRCDEVGAAATPPVWPFECGESITTTIVSSGDREGMKPTNDALWWSSNSGR